MAATDAISSQGEDYLEAIYELGRDRGLARPRDIASRLGVHKSTVTGALQSLAARGLVEYTPYEAAALTPEGESLAREVSRRHEAIGRFLRDVLLLDPERTQSNACRLEHAVGPQLFDRLVAFGDFIDRSPSFRRKWLAANGVSCTCRERGKLCKHCRARREETKPE